VTSFSALLSHILAVIDDEGETEALLQLLPPLGYHGWRCGDDDSLDPLSQHQLAKDQSRLDRFPQADVVGDEEVDARE
jgi:hypothetical protein